MGTPRSYTVTTVKGLQVLADRVPFIETEDLTKVRSGSTGTTFEMMTRGRKVPRDWKSWLVPLESVIHVHDVMLPGKPLISYVPTDIRRAGGGKIQVDAVTLEFFLMNDCYLGDMSFEQEDIVSGIGAYVGLMLEHEGVGWGLQARATPSGEIRNRDIFASDALTPAAFFEREGIAWNIAVEQDEAGNYESFLDLELPQAVNTATHVAFELGKNISEFDYSAPRSAGVFGTQLIVYGDNDTRSQAQTDTDRELRVPRRTIRLSVPGLTTAEDCTYYAEQVKDDFFLPRDAVTLTARDNGSTMFADIHSMKATALVNIDSPEMHFVHHTIIGGWSVPKNLRSFTPTLLVLGVGSVKFPKSVDPAIDTSLDEIKDSIPKGDPLAKGRTWTSADGTRTYIGPDGYSRTAADGTALGERSDEVFVQQTGGYSLAILKQSRGIEFMKGADFENPEAKATITLQDAANGIPGSQALVLTAPGLPTPGGFIRMEDTGNIGVYSKYGLAVRTGFSGTDMGFTGKPTTVAGRGVKITSVFDDIREEGNVVVTGSHTVEGSKQFGMALPATPEGDPALYVKHASTESDRNGVMYWGEAQTGSDGFVTVTLPEYFERLTFIKDRAVFLQPKSRCSFVPFPSDVINGEFTIEADPGVKLSWQVLAVRKLLDEDGVDRLGFKAAQVLEGPQLQ